LSDVAWTVSLICFFFGAWEGTGVGGGGGGGGGGGVQIPFSSPNFVQIPFPTPIFLKVCFNVNLSLHDPN